MKIKRLCGIFFIIIFLTSTLVGCSLFDNNQTGNNNFTKKQQIPEFLYNSLGECFAFYENGYLYDIASNTRLAMYDEDKKIFYDSTGYYGELYKDKYLLYNLATPYNNVSYGILPIAPIATMKAIPQNTDSIILPENHINCPRALSMGILDAFTVNVNATKAMSVGVNVSFNIQVVLNSPKYVIADAFITGLVTITYQGSNYQTRQYKTFTKTFSFSGRNANITMQTTSHPEHSYYTNFTVYNATISVSSVSGTVYRKVIEG